MPQNLCREALESVKKLSVIAPSISRQRGKPKGEFGGIFR